MILILSINPLSYIDSNGRTIANMFLSYKKNDLLNVFISGTPNPNLANFIKITDKDALLGFVKEHSFNDNKANNNPRARKQSQKNISKVIIREFIWKHSIIKKKLIKRLSAYDITDIFIQLGDYSFILELGLFIAKELNLRIITFNTEDYYFKTWDYYKQKNAGFLFNLHQKQLKDSYNKIYSISEKNVFLTDDLKEIHKKRFNFASSIVVYTSSGVTPLKSACCNKIVSYCGNLNNGRDKVLINLIDCINKEDDSFFINIYSPNLPESVKTILPLYKNVFYKGFVSYESTIDIISKSFLNVSIDGFDSYSKKDTVHAFSTKIADLLSSGNRVLVITPKGSTTYNYISSSCSAYICSDLHNLKDVVHEIFSLGNKKYLYRKNALLLANKNHNARINSSRLKAYFDDKENICFDILVTTVNKASEDVYSLANEMNIKTKCIIRSQNKAGNLFASSTNGWIKAISASDIGTSKNRNELFNLSTSDYILFADDDIIFANDYESQVSNAIRNNFYPEAIEFSFFGENKKMVKRKNKKSKYFGNSKYGVWFLLLSRKAVSDFFEKKPFNEKFGPGTKYKCGEDSIFRFKIYKYFKNIVDSKYTLGRIGDKPSTWFAGKNSDYFGYRSVYYGFMYPRLYPLFLIRLKIFNVFNKNCKLILCISKAKEGKRLRSVQDNN